MNKLTENFNNIYGGVGSYPTSGTIVRSAITAIRSILYKYSTAWIVGETIIYLLLLLCEK